ncbi:MAG TPA: hypothetical protein VM077_00345 [Candidatus Limnocylindrales bacterium]|nr:hypothetical protein [Candidatus Limnocylindrales bacterium]
MDNSATKTPQPAVVNRGGIQVNLPNPSPKDTIPSQDDSSPAQSVPQQNTSSTSQNESVTVPAAQPSQAVPVAQVEEKPQAPPSIPQPVSAPRSKEQEPVSAPLPDVAKMSEAEIVEEEKVVEKELESFVEKSPDAEKPDIPKDVQQAGVTHVGEDVPVHPTTSGFVSLPMSYDEAEFTRKKYKWKSSVAWLAAVVMYHWKKIKITSKEVKNKEE